MGVAWCAGQQRAPQGRRMRGSERMERAEFDVSRLELHPLDDDPCRVPFNVLPFHARLLNLDALRLERNLPDEALRIYRLSCPSFPLAGLLRSGHLRGAEVDDLGEAEGPLLHVGFPAQLLFRQLVLAVGSAEVQYLAVKTTHGPIIRIHSGVSDLREYRAHRKISGWREAVDNLGEMLGALRILRRVLVIRPVAGHHGHNLGAARIDLGTKRVVAGAPSRLEVERVSVDEGDHLRPDDLDAVHVGALEPLAREKAVGLNRRVVLRVARDHAEDH
mmetsp:Transcript_26608/g.49710  ORF Transcript_26608/g.49710 Transcript_26608/m.49710 type:complete len:275 (-) Transcript_26608:292-1116(-)